MMIDELSSSSLSSMSTGILNSLSPSTLDSLLEHVTELLHSQQTLLTSLSLQQKSFTINCESKARLLAPHFTKLSQSILTLQSLNSRILLVKKKLNKMKSRTFELQTKTLRNENNIINNENIIRQQV